MFGINGGELLVLALLAAVLIGPQRMPEYARKFGRLVREFRRFASDTKARVEQEVGETLPDFSALDPRQYDPRRIIREAILEDPKPDPKRPDKPKKS
jgi:sec-independent protein translocase protein TatB